ncbi:CDP-6-deoxy-delta-3,4-glucoseen reductase [Chitinibacter bivalviorum]|uniref:CDP-6-deoxy-delta-3,4-glucoseen reductase n=1 Tax=Chitinibacter bivalviorum TaxID=2739434 RepID=A0A7H9BHG7_9NEIS|nr:CDP-6-deoxy-delta-3,4-glucoseen reductase [Chitinibacter bivalviorum]QLG87772.1 CDP-6-deoxy-delta-3,4-glucoseen reductase [Chitinibacter bivalviorum]
MSKQLIIEPSGQQLSVFDDETLLDAAMREGFNMPYGCKNGSCGACKGKVLQGEVSHGDHSETALTHAEMEKGMALFCCAKPISDSVSIECREIAATKDIQIKTLPTRIEKIDKVSHDVAILTLKLPSTEKLAFLAGQYIDIHTKTGKKRSFSIANAPHQEGFIELHIRHVPGGEFSGYVWETMKEREIFRFTGPLGSFFLREDSDKPIILLATGTGFAPIKGIVEHALKNNIQREIVLYWGCRSLEDLYLPHIPSQWQQQHPNISFIPVLSEPKVQDQWQGRTGLVHEAVMADFSSLKHYQVYACGAPVMVEAAFKHFVSRGLPEEEFFSDAFFSSKDLK